MLLFFALAGAAFLVGLLVKCAQRLAALERRRWAFGIGTWMALYPLIEFVFDPFRHHGGWGSWFCDGDNFDGGSAAFLWLAPLLALVVRLLYVRFVTSAPAAPSPGTDAPPPPPEPRSGQ